MEEVTIIIPVKDEENGLRFLLDDFQSSNLSADFNIQFIFVIDHRTSDDSREIARSFSKQIINQQETHGKGAAMRQAIQYWKTKKTPKIIFLDADGSYSFEGVRDVIDTLGNGADIVSGSRFLGEYTKPIGMSRLHVFGNRALSIISSIRNWRKISDLCTGLWGFTSDALSEFDFQSDGFDFEAEIFGLSRRKRLNHREIPIVWSQRKGGVSKLRSLRDGIIILIRIIRT